MSNSTTSSVDSRPAKPSKGFPLFPHRSGQWCKKIKSKAYYFGSWRADPTGQEALAVYEAEEPFLKRGEVPPLTVTGEAITFKDVCNLFLESKEQKVKDGEVSELTFNGYLPTCKRMCSHFGRTTKVESIEPKGWSAYRSKLIGHFAPTSLSVEIAKIRAIFKWGKDSKLHGEVIFGPDFKRSPAKLVRKFDTEGGKKIFSRDEIHAILGACDLQLKALVLMGLNTAFGNGDLSSLPESAVDLENGWVVFSRVKTAVERRCPLWPETIEAIKAWLPKRPKPTEKEAKGKIFLTSTGRRWVRQQAKQIPTPDRGVNAVHVDALSGRFRRLLKKLEINSRRGLGFYALRHTSATIASEAKDPQAVGALLGHIDPSQSAAYIESISDERLLAVTETVRRWLFGEEGQDDHEST